MALKDLLGAAPTPATDRPVGISCETYVRGDGKRCLHYVAGGACALPGKGRCSEWLKANGYRSSGGRASAAEPNSAAPPVPAAPAPRGEIDLFGNAVSPVARPEEAHAARRSSPVAEPRPPTGARSPSETASRSLPALSAADIESFKALGAEVRMVSDSIGELWLVPAYTGKPRKEITPEHAATLVHLRSAFPGAQICSFNTPFYPERPERPQRRS